MHAHGLENLEGYTASSRILLEAATALFERIVNPDLLIRRLYLTACRVLPEAEAPKKDAYEQLDLFTDYAAVKKHQKEEAARLARERKRQEAMLEIKRKFGKNAILKGINFQEGATGRERNGQIGGHKA